MSKIHTWNFQRKYLALTCITPYVEKLAMSTVIDKYQHYATIYAFTSGLPNAICRIDVALKSKNHPSFGLVKAWYCKKKLQYYYSTIANLQWYCSSIVKQNNNFLFSSIYIYICHVFSLSLSLSLTFSVSSLSTMVHFSGVVMGLVEWVEMVVRRRGLSRVGRGGWSSGSRSSSSGDRRGSWILIGDGDRHGSWVLIEQWRSGGSWLGWFGFGLVGFGWFGGGVLMVWWWCGDWWWWSRGGRGCSGWWRGGFTGMGLGLLSQVWVWVCCGSGFAAVGCGDCGLILFLFFFFSFFFFWCWW